MDLFPRVVWIELVLLFTSLLLLMFGVSRDQDALLLIAGSCFIALGLLVFSEQRRALSGRMGETRRHALGPGRIRIWTLRAGLWLVVGVVTIGWRLFSR